MAAARSVGGLWLGLLLGIVCCDPVEAGPVLETLNADRTSRGLEALGTDPRLDAVAREIAAEVTKAGSAESVALDSDALSARLRQQGYTHRLLVVGYAVGLEESRLAGEWSAADPDTWERLLEPRLRDAALVRGETRSGPFHLLLAAVSQNDAKAQEAEGLADLDAVRARVVNLTNEHRRDAGLIEFRADLDLDRLAQAYAEDMLRRGFYGHESPEGQSAMDRLRSARVPVRRAGENLAEGQPSAEVVVKSWYDSPNHQRNLLHKAFRRMGTGLAVGEGPDGVYKILWVQLFTSERRPVL